MVMIHTPSISPSCQLNGGYSLAGLWAKRYIKGLVNYSQGTSEPEAAPLWAFDSQEGRSRTASKMLKALNFASAQAWSKTEGLLSTEVERHGIDPQHIDPWLIAQKSYHLFQQVLHLYQQGLPPDNLSSKIGPDCSQVRQLFTSKDPRVLGFVSMQIHYTGQTLLESLSSAEKALLEQYFKVVDDHLYMPLQRAYAGAAICELDSLALKAVQALLPISSRIAEAVCVEVVRQHATYRSFSGYLRNSHVRASSIRDVEMFQLYLCVCLLENNIEIIQEELFPLCVMLYPSLGIRWWLVRQLLSLLEKNMRKHLPNRLFEPFQPYLMTMAEIFAPDVVGD